ncbi:MAG: hypothetical protein MRY83_12230, partial [Flavobacteriales bacterium]|nr:hypothetical protein [Flavobacteriales bacterium]
MLKNYVTILSVFLVLKFNAQNVGISAGSFTPNQMLHIHGASNEGIKVSNPTSGNGSNDGADFLVDGLKLNLIQNENAPIGLFTNGLERFSILGNGNIGIGSTSPAYLLDVSGTLHCDLLDINGAYNLPSVAGSSTEFLRGDGTWRSVPSLYSGSGSLSGATVVTYGGNNLINDLTGSGEFRIQKDAQNVTNQEALMIDYNSSGILSTNRVHRAALFDMDANNVTNSSGNFNLYGHELQINTGGSTNSNNARGYITNYTNTSTGTQSNVYGNYNYLRNNSSGNINNVYGSYSWIRKDNTGSNNNSYGFYSRMDRNSGTSGNAYCFYGSMEGIHTNEWGIYITGENENYLSGNLWLGTTSSTYKLDVAGTAHVDQLNVNGAYDLPTSVGTTSQYLRGDGTWQTIPSGTDDQNLSVGAGTPTTSVIEMENGNNITLIEGSNIQLTENTTNGEITIEATGDGTGTDDQNITGSTLIGTNLTIGIENGSSQIVDM